MKILAMDSSSQAASCAIWEEGKLIAESFLHTGFTHSQTLMPLVERMLTHSGVSLQQIDLFAVAAGPGSFTGLRIGTAAAKGMAMALNKPCAAVSTLEALAQNLSGFDGILVPALDARCQQVYTALFDGTPHGVVRLEEDQAIPLEELARKLKAFAHRPIYFIGDGAALCRDYLNIPNVYLAPPHLLYQRAASVAAVAQRLWQNGQTITPAELVPVYLRLPQAERERLEKRKGEAT